MNDKLNLIMSTNAYTFWLNAKRTESISLFVASLLSSSSCWLSLNLFTCHCHLFLFNHFTLRWKCTAFDFFLWDRLPFAFRLHQIYVLFSREAPVYSKQWNVNTQTHDAPTLLTSPKKRETKKKYFKLSMKWTNINWIWFLWLSMRSTYMTIFISLTYSN